MGDDVCEFLFSRVVCGFREGAAAREDLLECLCVCRVEICCVCRERSDQLALCESVRDGMVYRSARVCAEI